MTIGFKSFKKLVSFLWLKIARLPMPGHWRYHLIKKAGVRFNLPSHDRKFVFIGDNLTFDSMHPEEIEIGNYVHITTGCILLTHYLDTSKVGVYWKTGHITIKDGAFIGANSIISKPVTIGEYSIVGSGSVVTKDIPPYEIWAGNPARFIKKINI